MSPLRLVRAGDPAARPEAQAREVADQPMSEVEVAELESTYADRKRFAAAHVAMSAMDVKFVPVENDPSTLATVAVDMPYPISMGLSGIVVRRLTPAELELRGPGDASVKLEFGRPETEADELLDKAVTPKILRAWEEHHKRSARERFQIVPPGK